MTAGSNPVQPPRWRKPGTLGYPASVDAVSNVAAPLLGGFSLASVVTIAPLTAGLRWPGVSLALLALAAVLMVNTLQCNYHARANLWSPGDVHTWWPELGEHPEWEQRLRADHAAALARWSRWARWTVRLYNAGIVALLAGLTSVAAPAAASPQPAPRWTATGIGAAALLTEIGWILIGLRRSRS